MWFHWVPAAWRGPFPFEIGLYYFLTLTGFLITRILLRARDAGEKHGVAWRVEEFFGFLKRRVSRILVPCYVAMFFALIVGAPDIRSHAMSYFAHVSNFHIARMSAWPSGTAHYWTLAIQVQFYFFWPLVVFLVPRRLLAWAFVVCAAIAPLSRLVIESRFPEIHHPGAITSSAMDYLGIGALLALALEGGMKPGDRRLKSAALLAFAGYVWLYAAQELGREVPGLCYIQQTLLSVVFAGLISATLAEFQGWLGMVLNHPAVQHVGRLSYGLYLFHTAVPLFLGLVLPWLWLPLFEGPLLVVRLLAFALASWGIAWLCWRWLEGPARWRVPRLAALLRR
jgi:peptidoglycan/LPS O-acetylase OafA/YrhL